MELKDLVEGIIYVQKSKSHYFIFRYRIGERPPTIGYGNYIEVFGNYFCKSVSVHNSSQVTVVKATYQEEQHLISCEKANKYVECPLVEENILENLQIW